MATQKTDLKTQLDNSKRRFYKATYQTALPETSKDESGGSIAAISSSAPQLMRGVEKTNFIHTLSVTPAELDQLTAPVITQAKGGKSAPASTNASAGASPALQTIRSLVLDTSPTATLRHSPEFAKIDAQQLVDFAHSLAQLRSTVNVDWGHQTLSQISGFQNQLLVLPVGRLHLERIEMSPAGIEHGELVHSVPLTPKEIVNISHREWSTRTEEFENIVEDSFEGYSEQGVAEKTDVSQASDNESKHDSALSVGASLSTSYSAATFSITAGANTNFNTQSTDSQTQKDSREHATNITRKASARSRKNHKFSFRVSSVAGTEDQAVRVITNPSDTQAMRVDYYQLMRKWKVDLFRYGLRMTFDIAIPNPGALLIQRILQLDALNAEINTPFSFALKITDVDRTTYQGWAATYQAQVDAPPEDTTYYQAHKEFQVKKSDASDWIPDAFDFDVDPSYQVDSATFSADIPNLWSGIPQHFNVVGQGDILASRSTTIAALVGLSGKLAVQYEYQGLNVFTTALLVTMKLKDSVFAAWQLRAWNQIREASFEAYTRNIQFLQSQRDALVSEIGKFDALTLRRMEQEEIMKYTLQWMFGPNFKLVPDNLPYTPDPNNPNGQILDPNGVDVQGWQRVLGFGETIKFLHEAVEWENMLYFCYPYFWDSTKNWPDKLFLDHPDPRHRTFLRAGSARVVLTIRPGFEEAFSTFMEGVWGSTVQLPPGHPYVTIAQDIQNYANTNYPGIPPANPAQDSRPLLYPEQKQAWADIQILEQLLERYKLANNDYPSTAQGLGVLSSVTDPAIPSVPLKDPWTHPYHYKYPGDYSDYDLYTLGADNKPGGDGKDTDIWNSAEANLIATWFEYTPTSALDLVINMSLPTQPQPL